MNLELKRNRSARAAIAQIRAKEYHGRLKDCGRVLLAGISHVKNPKKAGCRRDTCQIELWANTREPQNGSSTPVSPQAGPFRPHPDTPAAA